MKRIQCVIIFLALAAHQTLRATQPDTNPTDTNPIDTNLAEANQPSTNLEAILAKAAADKAAADKAAADKAAADKAAADKAAADKAAADKAAKDAPPPIAKQDTSQTSKKGFRRIKALAQKAFDTTKNITQKTIDTTKNITQTMSNIFTRGEESNRTTDNLAAEQQRSMETGFKKIEENKAATEEETKKRAAEAKRLAEEETKKRAAEAKRLAEEEATKRAAEAKRLAEEEATKRAAEAKRLAEEEAKRLAEEEATKRAEEAKRLAEEEATKRAEEAKRLAEEEATKRAEEEAKRLAEEEAKRLTAAAEIEQELRKEEATALDEEIDEMEKKIEIEARIARKSAERNALQRLLEIKKKESIDQDTNQDKEILENLIDKKNVAISNLTHELQAGMSSKGVYASQNRIDRILNQCTSDNFKTLTDQAIQSINSKEISVNNLDRKPFDECMGAKTAVMIAQKTALEKAAAANALLDQATRKKILEAKQAEKKIREKNRAEKIEKKQALKKVAETVAAKKAQSIEEIVAKEARIAELQVKRTGFEAQMSLDWTNEEKQILTNEKDNIDKQISALANDVQKDMSADEALSSNERIARITKKCTGIPKEIASGFINKENLGSINCTEEANIIKQELLKSLEQSKEELEKIINKVMGIFDVSNGKAKEWEVMPDEQKVLQAMTTEEKIILLDQAIAGEGIKSLADLMGANAGQLADAVINGDEDTFNNLLSSPIYHGSKEAARLRTLVKKMPSAPKSM
jgi:hypothetical protein